MLSFSLLNTWADTGKVRKLKSFSRLGIGLACLLLVGPAWSLVDYSSAPGGSVGPKVSAGPGQSTMQAGEGSARSSASWGGKRTHPYSKKFIELRGTYDHLNLKSPYEGSVQRYLVDLHLRPLPQFYFDLSYWQGTDERPLPQAMGRQEGNSKFILGLNWLQFGEALDRTTLDLYGGFSPGTKQSSLGTSRDDKIVGFQSTKLFYNFLLGLNGELILTGRPANEQELGIGNVLKLGVGLGWIVSDDIRIGLEAYTYKIYAMDQDHPNRLNRDLSFSSLSPKIYLGLFPSTELSMGLHLKTRNIMQQPGLDQLRLFDVPGLYGNSFFIGLNFSV